MQLINTVGSAKFKFLLGVLPLGTLYSKMQQQKCERMKTYFGYSADAKTSELFWTVFPSWHAIPPIFLILLLKYFSSQSHLLHHAYGQNFSSGS